MRQILRTTIAMVPRPVASVLALPQVRTASLTLSFGREKRFWLSMGLIATGCLAALGYILAVNAILLSGEAIHRGQRELAILEREVASLRSTVAEKHSPAWITEYSRANGMVEAAGVRYLTEDALVLSR